MTEPRIQLLDDLGAEFARVAATPERARSRFWPEALSASSRSVLAIGLSVLALVAAGAFAVPPTRAAIEDIASSFAGWIAGDEEQAPGRARRPEDDVPYWFRAGGNTRVVAKADGVVLYARFVQSEDRPQIEFGLGEDLGVIVGDSAEGWRRRFEQHAVVVLGPALFGPQDQLDDRGRFPLLGVTARSVKRLELRYMDGPSLIQRHVDGGFVLIADAWRKPRDLVAYDAAGRVLERSDVNGIDMRYVCDKEPGCPSR